MSGEVFVLSGTVSGVIIMLLASRSYHTPVWKTVILALLLATIGVIGTKLLFFVEAGEFGGSSYFGSVFLMPILAPLVALMLRVKISDALDMVSPCMMMMLLLMKINCCIEGCCKGIVLSESVNQLGEIVTRRFPSQIVEAVAAALLCALLLWFIRKAMFRGRLYPVFMMIYGVVRFVLNLLRETTPVFLGLAFGNIWSIVAVAIGGAWVLAMRKKA